MGFSEGKDEKLSDSMNVSVTCPRCGAAGQAEVWTNINTQDSPDEAQWLIDGFLFQYECPQCGNTFTLNHDCVYHDVVARALVMYAADRTRAQDAAEALRERIPPGYRGRAVHSPAELREKAAIFRDGLDDRAVEVAKAAVYDRFVEEGKVMPAARAFYGALGEEGEIIVEFVGGPQALETAIPRSVYEGIAASFTDEQPLVVDRAWATRILAEWS